MPISAPYNFVPLNKKVFYPPWGPFVTHDVPFKDGLSGKIELEITAKSPIFIRKPYDEGNEGDTFYEDKDGKRISKEFCHIKIKDNDGVDRKKYFIPGSSIKGEVTNIIENLTFSELKYFNNKHFSVRDMTNHRTLVGIANSCGFLIKENDNYKVKSIASILTVSHEEIIKKFNFIINSDLKTSTSQAKYDLINNLDLKYRIVEAEMIVRGRRIPKSIGAFDDSSDTVGKLVFTNSIEGKKNEFIFAETEIELNISNKVVHDLIQVYTGTGSKTDYKFLLDKLENNEPIPIFINKKRNDIISIGFTQLFKLNYKHDVKHFVNQTLISNKRDFTSLLYGDIDDTNDNLKGRIHFGHAFANNPIPLNKTFTITLGQPNPTFYPYYIKQTIDDDFLVTDYKTFNDNGQIAGRKRYPVIMKEDDYFDSYLFKEKQTDSNTQFNPLNKGSKFISNIIFHNILPQELGCLLSALTFHNNTELKHKIGLAKPYGMGIVKFDITSLYIEDKDNIKNINNYLTCFENEINKFTISNYNKNWIDTPQIKELFAMATQISNNKEATAYLKLDVQNKIDEFNKLKKDRFALPRYSNFMGVNPKIKSYLSHKVTYKSFHLNTKDISKQIKEGYLKRIENLQQSIDDKLTELKKVRQLKKVEILQKYREKLKEKRKTKLLQTGITDLIKNIDIKRDTKNIRKIIDEWLKKTNSKQIPANDTEMLTQKLKEIFKNLNKKNKSKWLLEYDKNAELKKVATWVGKEKAILIFKEIIKS